VDIIVEDVTALRTLEDKLRRSQRIEAVGRIASEVAASCDSLLRDVCLDGQRWLAATDLDSDSRSQGEFLLSEVTRAAGVLRQLAAYGQEQANALTPVAAQRVLLDLAPVLRRIAGDDIELAVQTAEVHDLDVDIEEARLERIVVNAARYARERMPCGGRMQIKLASASCDSRVMAKHPNVRPGEHVLITLTGVRLDSGGDDSPSPTAAGERPEERPGADLGALLQLVDDSGGHVWMAAERAGDLTMKIHLPRRAREEAPPATATARVAQSGRSLIKWFRH
jgi:hypothetical protein